MPKFTFTIALALLALLTCGGCRDSASDHPQGPSPQTKAQLPTYRVGYMICNSAEETMYRFAPLTKYLGEQLGVHLEGVAINTLDFGDEIDNLDFTHTNSLLYIMYHRYNGLDILAVEKRGELGNRSKGIVAVRKDSGIKTLADLKGKTMIFGPMLAPTGYMSQIYALKKLGFDVDNDLSFYTIPTGSFKHEKVIYAVNFGKYDAGAFPYYDFEIMRKQGKVKAEKFRILAEGPLIPYCNYGVTQRVDDDLARRFKQALLAITPDDTVEFKGERLKVLTRAGLDGFTSARDADFDIVRKMAKETNMPPYQEF